MYDNPEISINFANFPWKKSNAGYAWDDNICIDELFSKKNDEKPPYIMPVPETTSFITTYPLQEIDYYVFAHFAELYINDSETAKEDIINFANKYGLLTHDLFLDNDNFANSLNFWCQQIWIAKNVFRIWQAIKKKDTSFLSKVIMVNKDNIYYIFGEPEDIDIYRTKGIKRDQNGILTDIKGMFAPSKKSVLAEQNKFVLNNLKPNDYIFPAQLVLQKVINEQLEKFPVHPRLLFDKYNKLTQFFMPTSLMAAMWFQMFQIITGEKKIKQCIYCKQWFDATDAKANKQYHGKCNVKYRVQKHRKFQTVKDLLAEGLTIPEIAEKINIKSEIIELWLKEWEADKNAK